MRSEKEQKNKTILEDVRETYWRVQDLKDYLKLMRAIFKKEEENISGRGVPCVKVHRQEAKYIVQELQVSQFSWSIG